MALITPNRSVPFYGQTTYEVSPPAGKSWLVKGIAVRGVASGWLTVKIDRTTVGYYMVDSGNIGNHLGFGVQDAPRRNLLDFLRERGVWEGYPVAQGQTLQLSGLGSSNLYGYLEYDEYEAGDIRPDMPNGTDASEFTYVCYGNTGATQTTAGEKLYSTSLMPAEYPDFPFGQAVPSRYELTWLGICASDRTLSGATTGDYVRTTYYKFVRGREVLFDPTRQGLFAWGLPPSSGSTFYHGQDLTMLGDCTDRNRREPYMLEEPIVFGPGEEMLVYVNLATAGTAPNFTVAYQTIGLIFRARVLR